MDSTKYIGMDVHKETISAAVLDSTGKLVMESILETKAATILQFIDGLRGSLAVTFEEGTCAARPARPTSAASTSSSSRRARRTSSLRTLLPQFPQQGSLLAGIFLVRRKSR